MHLNGSTKQTSRQCRNIFHAHPATHFWVNGGVRISINRYFNPGSSFALLFPPREPVLEPARSAQPLWPYPEQSASYPSWLYISNLLPPNSLSCWEVKETHLVPTRMSLWTLKTLFPCSIWWAWPISRITSSQDPSLKLPLRCGDGGVNVSFEFLNERPCPLLQIQTPPVIQPIRNSETGKRVEINVS